MMNEELKKQIETLALNQLMQSPLGDRLQIAMSIFEKAQKNLTVLSEKQEDGINTKIVTILTFSILKQFANGKSLSDFNTEVWKGIANDVSEYAILQDDQKYSQFVFHMYEQYIRQSVTKIEGFASESTVTSIKSLADELYENSKKLVSQEIDEVTYIESCLWISLEAMIKLIAAMNLLTMDKDYADFVQALASYAFEYGRYTLYRREQELVNEFMQSQNELDKNLEKKYAAYIKDLETQANYFYTLIDNAFAPDFRSSFLHSITLAQTAGVEKNEILNSTEDIDSFFMD